MSDSYEYAHASGCPCERCGEGFAKTTMAGASSEDAGLQNPPDRGSTCTRCQHNAALRAALRDCVEALENVQRMAIEAGRWTRNPVTMRHMLGNIGAAGCGALIKARPLLRGR